MPYQLTPKGSVRSATSNIEKMIKQRDISELNEQDRMSIREDAQTIIAALGGSFMIKPGNKSLPDALGVINSMLNMADHEMRELNTLERDVVIDAAGSILLTL